MDQPSQKGIRAETPWLETLPPRSCEQKTPRDGHCSLGHSSRLPTEPPALRWLGGGAAPSPGFQHAAARWEGEIISLLICFRRY